MLTKRFVSLRILIFCITTLAILTTSVSGISAMGTGSATNSPASALGNYAIVFVSRRIPANGSAYYNATGSLPGVQPWGRFQVASPGKLIVREANGSLRTLINGSNPTAASLNLIDVNAPDVSYDATKIVFAGLTNGTYSQSPMNSPGAWRIYVINVDGTGLRQVTLSDRNISLAQFGSVASNFTNYDDTDPVWLPDGRIVFSSTRWPSFGMYGAALTSNLHVINADGTGLHRITAERNGAERPVVDPLTGRIIYSRWWRNFRLGTNNMATLVAPEGGYIMKDGICALSRQGAECQEAGGLSNLERNSWHLATVNPDGTGLAQFAGRSMSTFIGENINSAYGGSFAADGSFYANFFPMSNGTEAAGFGGIRRFQRGANGYTPIIGITTRDENILQFVRTNPNSYGVYVGNYAAEPAVLPDGRLVISWAANIAQDYGLYTINADGSGLTLVYDNPGTTELRTKVIIARTVPTIIPDKVTQVASKLPPLAQGPYDIDGTFTFKALNVYFNAPVDTNIISAIPVGSANSIRFFIDHQRSQQRGSFETLDWPILLTEAPINPDGSVTVASPANVPLFEQIRTKQPGYSIPISGRGTSPDEMPGAAHVAGLNFGRTGEVAACVGCHAGHTMIPVPANPADAQWTNLAPGATVTYSSLHTSLPNGNGAVDRHVKLRIAYNNHYRYWQSREGQNPNTQWLQLTFPVPVTVRTVRLYNIPSTESSTKVLNTTVKLYSDAAGTQQVETKTSGALSENGTDVAFSSVRTRVVRIEFTSVNGSTAGLGEVEVIASGGDMATISGNVGAANVLLSDQNGPLATSGPDGTYSISVPNGWSGTVTPTNACFTFSPTNRTYSNLTVSQTAQNYTSTFNPAAGCANVNVEIGGNNKGTYGIPAQSSKLDSYAGVNAGPVKLISNNAVPLVATERVIYAVNGVNTSFSEMLALPNSQLDTTYWLPWYNNTGLDTQLRIGNVSGTPASVHVYIGGVEMPGSPFALTASGAGQSVRLNFAGVNNGPVQIVSNVNIVAAERLIYKVNGVDTSFSEMLALPNSQLDTTYWLPWYNNTGLDTQLRIGNVSGVPASVHVYIGGVEMPGSPFALTASGAGQSIRLNFAGVNNGPVQIVSNVNIVAAERLIYKVNGVDTSFTEMLALPNSQLDTTYWLPWYNNTGLDTQLRIGNVSGTPASVHVYIGGVEMPGSPFALTASGAGQSVRLNFAGVNNGPVQIVSNVNIVAAERLIYKVNGVDTSFTEMLALPNSQLDTTYWLPWYNNTGLDTQLRFGVP